MQPRFDAYLQRQQQRFMRPDARRYLRPDAARFGPAAVALRVGRILETKWDGQPRIEEGEGEGRFTFGRQNEGTDDSSGRPRVYITRTEGVGDAGLGDLENGSGSNPGDDPDSLLLAAAIPPGIGHNQGPPLEDASEIPEVKPARSPSTILRAAANWIARALVARAFLAIAAFIGILRLRSWARGKAQEIATSLDPPRTMEELEAAVNVPRAGTELHHHKMEQHVSIRRGMTESQIDAPGNRVRIPTLKHYEITSWYRQPNRKYGGLTPRQYLA